MQEEMNSLHENHTFELLKLLEGRRALKNKWVYKITYKENKCTDFEELFSCVVKMTYIRVVMGLTTSLNLEVEQLDVKTALFHGDLEEEIYIEQPEGFRVKGKEDIVCRLKKSLYGLKQAF